MIEEKGERREGKRDWKREDRRERGGEVNDVTHVIDGIRNTWIGSHKLCANMARFDRKVADKSTIHSKPQVSGLSGFWIAIEFQSTDSCKKFKDHAGIKSWFSSIRKASKDFFIRDRVAWIDVEGVPFQACTHQAFTKIASIWGELIYTVNSKGSNMYSVRLCIKTTIDTLIAESLKLDVKIMTVRSKEITGWILEFLEDTSRIEVEGKDDVEGPLGSDSNVDTKNGNEDDDEEERVDDSYFTMSSPHEDSNHISDDPFGLDELIKKAINKDLQEEELSDPVFPPGFTPDEANCNYQNESGNISNDVNADLIKTQRDEGRSTQDYDVGSFHEGSGESQSLFTDSMARPKTVLDGFSMIDKFSDVIKFGQAIGFDMKGCEKDMKRIITRMGGTIDHK
ncbi:hypothetical protein Tco_0598629 [Tanacetum coccineum]